MSGSLAKKEEPAKEKDRREWLKINHKLGTNSAWWIAARVEGKNIWPAAPKYVDGLAKKTASPIGSN